MRSEEDARFWFHLGLPLTKSSRNNRLQMMHGKSCFFCFAFLFLFIHLSVSSPASDCPVKFKVLNYSFITTNPKGFNTCVISVMQHSSNLHGLI
ncbi:hypothetical protein SLE2022_219640 [Rubroshorea leprosula]